jgi:hypothetical protein
MHYNSGWIHQNLRVMPAMEPVITDTFGACKELSHLLIQQRSTTLITSHNSIPVKKDFHLPSLSITATHL